MKAIFSCGSGLHGTFLIVLKEFDVDFIIDLMDAIIVDMNTLSDEVYRDYCGRYGFTTCCFIEETETEKVEQIFKKFI